MSTEHTYPLADINNHDTMVLACRLEASAYTHESINHNQTDETITAKITEDAVSADDLKTALNTAAPGIGLVPSSFSIAADGAATQVVNVSGPNSATINLRWLGIMPVSVKQLTLDAGGAGAFTVGPFLNGQGKTAHNSPISIDASMDGGGCKSDQVAITVT